MATTRESPAGFVGLVDRRASARMDVLDRLDGQVVMSNVPVRLRDISAGGVATESAMPFPIGSRHLLRLTTPGGISVYLTGTVIHHTADSVKGEHTFVTGFAFVDDRSRQTEEAIQTLLDAIDTGVEP